MSEKKETENKTERPPVRITVKVGSMEFEIECREDQVQEIVQKILSTVSDYASKPMPSPPESALAPARAETCRGILERIWKEGWFVDPRSLNDIHREMTRIGYHYDRTAVAHALLDLVRDGLLTREGKPRRYLYVQKRPPNAV